MNFQTILLEKADAIATITLNRPQKRNAFTQQLLDEFVQAKADVAADPEVKVLIITGAGSAFCPGADFAAPQTPYKQDATSALKMRQYIISQEIQMLDLKRIPKPVIAMVNGPVVGAGCGFFLSSDIVIASEDATFGFGFVRLGFHPEVGITYTLPRLIGMPKACELLFCGKTIDAKEAERIGLINQVVSRDKLASVTRELALSLARGPSIAIGLMKISLHQTMDDGLRSALEAEARANAICDITEDKKEAIKAFLEKRAPIFQGK